MTDKTPPVLEEDLDALLAELEASVGVASPKPKIPAPAEASAPAPAAAEVDFDAELALLEAESKLPPPEAPVRTPVAEVKPVEEAPKRTRTPRAKVAEPAREAPVETLTVNSISAIGDVAPGVITASSIAATPTSDRRDMLIQLGSDRRQEMGGQLRILAKDDLESRARGGALQARTA